VCKIKEQNVGWDEFGTYDVNNETDPVATLIDTKQQSATTSFSTQILKLL